MSGWYPSGKDLNCALDSLGTLPVFIGEGNNLGKPLATIVNHLLPAQGALTDEDRLRLHDIGRVGLQVELYLKIICDLVLVLVNEGDTKSCVEISRVSEAGYGLRIQRLLTFNPFSCIVDYVQPYVRDGLARDSNQAKALLDLKLQLSVDHLGSHLALLDGVD
jgi:hypothetical protein